MILPVILLVGAALLGGGYWLGRLHELLLIEDRILLGRCEACRVSWILWDRDEPCPECGGPLHYRDRIRDVPRPARRLLRRMRPQ